MINIRKANARGRTKIDWLDSWHSFSFGHYYDPGNMGYGHLRVINDDMIAPGGEFATHGHRDMEIITYVLNGALEHRDSIGNNSVIKAGEVQRMSAGKGILHSESNASKKDPVHLLQIWILPDQQGIKPEYEQKDFARTGKNFQLVVSKTGREGSLKIHQDVDLYSLRLSEKKSHNFAGDKKNKFWVQVALGNVDINGKKLAQGDGATITDESELKIEAKKDADLLIFDLKKNEIVSF